MFSNITPLDLPLFHKLSQRRFILASTSPRRIEILQQMGFTNIEIIPSNFEEDLNKDEFTPEEYVRNTAMGKARAVYDELKSQNMHRNTVILAADTIISSHGKIYEKPKDKQEQLTNLKGFRDDAIINPTNSPQHVLSGVVVINVDAGDEEDEPNIHTIVEDTKMFFDPQCSDELISAYVDSNEGIGVAAGYRVQMRGALMMKGIEGDFYNVVGLPFRGTFTLLQRALGLD